MGARCREYLLHTHIQRSKEVTRLNWLFLAATLEASTAKEAGSTHSLTVDSLGCSSSVTLRQESYLGT